MKKPKEPNMPTIMKSWVASMGETPSKFVVFLDNIQWPHNQFSYLRYFIICFVPMILALAVGGIVHLLGVDGAPITLALLIPHWILMFLVCWRGGRVRDMYLHGVPGKEEETLTDDPASETPE